MNHQAIFNTHPNVLYIDDDVSYDSNDQVVSIDQAAYEAEVVRLEEEQAAREALRQSMISKLAATLTPEEAALLEELL